MCARSPDVRISKGVSSFMKHLQTCTEQSSRSCTMDAVHAKAMLVACMVAPHACVAWRLRQTQA